ncbi:larval cuticle protein A1A-like [Anopheles nili]|uniref:larval cuticle protein A1A-like n=1 Tax=Anopheles nili TaxID=185578 RepID=UPI00237A4E32|nr:larval cuticle protein A1A-like [Anopheles nili]
MKFLALLVYIEVVCGLVFAKETDTEERKLVSYETKIFHKVPEKTILEEKIDELKKDIVPIKKTLEKEEDEKTSIPQYEFGYGVKDPLTGDHKDQWEKRHGDHVKGSYRFDESDGTQRVVEYEADGKRGFEATVKNVEKKDIEEGVGEKKEGKVAHSYSYLKKIGH